jgi:radical SAM protein with 4Fe4S-binding SPASM domain
MAKEDKTAEVITSLEKSLGNPIFRSVLKFVSGKCRKCDRDRLEEALKLYVGSKKVSSWDCRIASFLVGKSLKYGVKAFGAEIDESFLEYLKDETTQKGIVNVIKGIAEYGITKPQKLYAPFLVVWDYTNACNLNCKHCYKKAGKPAADELSTKERKNVINQLAEAGVVSIAFSGGEPLTQKDFFDVAKYASRKGMYVSLATNGTLINKDIAKKIKQSGIKYVEISLDGTEKTHDKFRGVKGAWKRTIKGIKNCVNVGLMTCVATTVTKYNYNEIPKLIDLSIKLGAERFIAFNFIPTGRGKDIIDMDITPEQREKLLNFLYDKLEEGKIEVFSTAPQFARIALERIKTGKGKKIAPTHFAAVSLEGKTITLAQFIGGCGAGRLYCAIEPNGDIQPCVFMPIRVGNVKEGFEKVWHSSPILEQLRDRSRLKQHCGTCEYKFVCGGCRARAYAYLNDLNASDPGCIYNKNI